MVILTDRSFHVSYWWARDDNTWSVRHVKELDKKAMEIIFDGLESSPTYGDMKCEIDGIGYHGCWVVNEG